MLDKAYTTDGKEWIQAPILPRHTGGILGVYLDKDEEVDWTWGLDACGKPFLYGYTITRKGSTYQFIDSLARFCANA